MSLNRQVKLKFKHSNITQNTFRKLVYFWIFGMHFIKINCIKNLYFNLQTLFYNLGGVFSSINQLDNQFMNIPAVKWCSKCGLILIFVCLYGFRFYFLFVCWTEQTIADEYEWLSLYWFWIYLFIFQQKKKIFISCCPMRCK